MQIPRHLHASKPASPALVYLPRLDRKEGMQQKMETTMVVV